MAQIKCDLAKISVIVPVYNVEKYLNRCVESLINQSMHDIEIILVDDGSTDNCPTMCDNFAEKFANIKVIHKTNGGLILAWKEGLKFASGDFVGFVDSDDYCESDYYSKLYEPITKNADIDMVVGGFTEISTENTCVRGSAILEKGFYEDIEVINKIKKRFLSTKNVIIPSRWSKLIRRKILLNNVDLLDDKLTLAEDLCTTFACFLDVKQFAVVDAFGYNYIIYDNSMSHSFNVKILDSYDAIYSTLQRIKQEKNYTGDIYKELTYQMVVRVFRIITADISAKEKLQHLKYFRKKQVCKKMLAKNRCVLDKKTQQMVKLLFKLKLYRMIILCSIIWEGRVQQKKDK